MTAKTLRPFTPAFAAGAALLTAAGLTSSSVAHAAAQDYRFELTGKPIVSSGKNTVQVRLVHVADGKPVPDAVIFESKADMGPAGMPTMPAPVKALPAKDGVYSFQVEPAMTGTWALHLMAKVQGEPETIVGTINADLVK